MPLSGTRLQSALVQAITTVVTEPNSKIGLTPIEMPQAVAAHANLPTQLATAITMAVVQYLNTITITPGSITTAGGPAAQKAVQATPPMFQDF